MPGAVATSMDTTRWLGVMVNRGLDSTPDRDAALDYLGRIGDAFAAGPLGD